jgi:phenylalanyl-tRNA synthetase beta chain
LDLDRMLTHREPWLYSPPSQFPPVIFDLAFELDDAVAASAVMTAVAAADEELLESQFIFDVFRGPPVPEGRKSIAVRLTLRAYGRTLTDEEVAPILRSISSEVETRTGASLRGEA